MPVNNAMPPKFNPHIAERMALAGTESPLLEEVVKLRQEIAALRAELLPVPSLIVTGREALDEFKRLTQSSRKD